MLTLAEKKRRWGGKNEEKTAQLEKPSWGQTKAGIWTYAATLLRMPLNWSVVALEECHKCKLNEYLGVQLCEHRV